MATQAQTLTQLRLVLNEPSAVAWTDAELYGYINEAVADIARRTETIQKNATLTVAANTRKVTGPTDALRIHTVHWQADGDNRIHPLEIVDLHNMDAMWYTQQAITKGVPVAVTFWGYPPALSLTLYPTPNVKGDLLLHYYGLPDRLKTDGTDSTQTIVVPAGWEDLVVEYAAYLAQRRDANPRWQEHKQAYEEHVSDMLERTNRWTDQAGSIVPGTPATILPDWLTGL